MNFNGNALTLETSTLEPQALLLDTLVALEQKLHIPESSLTPDLTANHNDPPHSRYFHPRKSDPLILDTPLLAEPLPLGPIASDLCSQWSKSEEEINNTPRVQWLPKLEQNVAPQIMAVKPLPSEPTIIQTQPVRGRYAQSRKKRKSGF